MDLNRFTFTGNLTADPELRELPSGTSVCQLRIANNGLGRGDRDAVGYLNVSVYGKAGENCARYLSKGRPIAGDGRLEYHQWDQDGKTRSAIQVVASTVKFLGGGRANGSSSGDDEPASVSSDEDAA